MSAFQVCKHFVLILLIVKCVIVPGNSTTAVSGTLHDIETNSNSNGEGDHDIVLVNEPLVKMICKVLLTKKIVGLCESDLDSLQALGPVVYRPDSSTTVDTTDDSLLLYPYSFLVRRRSAKDNQILQNTKDNMECGNDPNRNHPISLLRVPNVRMENSNNKNKFKISSLSMLVQDDDNNTNKKNDQNEDFMASDASKFNDCIQHSLRNYTVQNSEIYINDENNTITSQEMLLSSWASNNKINNKQKCRGIAHQSFNKISDLLSEISEGINSSSGKKNKVEKRTEINQILRRITNAWGSDPSLVSNLLLAFGGCDTTDSYDEFLSCRLILGDDEDIVLDVNIHHRNFDPPIGKRNDEDINDFHAYKWNCETCGLHQHPRWFASRVVAGSVTYTVARPDCLVEGEEGLRSSMSTLDRDLGKYKNGTLVDKVGSRYHLGHESIVWETTEVLKILTNQSLVFPPSWYHRIIPQQQPPSSAKNIKNNNEINVSSSSHFTPVTLVAKYRMDPISFVNNDNIHGKISRRKQRLKQVNYWILKPKEVHANTSTKYSCYNIMHVILALRHPHLNVNDGIDLTPYCQLQTQSSYYQLKEAGKMPQFHPDKQSREKHSEL